MSPGSEARVTRILARAGLRVMWAELKSGAWGMRVGDRLLVVSDAEDCDRVPTPRDVVLCTYVADASGEWGEGDEEWPTTLRDALEFIARRKESEK